MPLKPNSIGDLIVRLLVTVTAIELSSNSDTGGFLLGKPSKIKPVCSLQLSDFWQILLMSPLGAERRRYGTRI